MGGFLWMASGAQVFEGRQGSLQIECRPHQGLSIRVGDLLLSHVLGLEVLDAETLGPKPLDCSAAGCEATLRQDTLLVQFPATQERPVECDIKWRIHAERIIDLEVSALTAGKWDNLAVQSLSRLPDGEVITLGKGPGEPGPTPVMLYRPTNSSLSYAEFCHPSDFVGVSVTPADQAGRGEGQGKARTTEVRFRLFGQDLEKGVIIRGRLRGLVLDRGSDLEQVRAAFERFVAEPPNLST
jgi:hypothetical protein